MSVNTEVVGVSAQYSVAFSFDHGVMSHLHAAGLAISTFQSAGHAVAELEVGVRHVRAQRQLEVAPVHRRHVLLELTDDRHVISVSGGGRDLADGGGAPGAAELDDATARAAPPDRLQHPGGQRRRPGPTLVRVEQHSAPGLRVVGPRQRRPACRPAPAAAAEKRRVVPEDATRGAAAILVVEQLDHDGRSERLAKSVTTAGKCV